MCSEQRTFHGQASDRVWFFSELLFQSVAAKKEKKNDLTGQKLTEYWKKSLASVRNDAVDPTQDHAVLQKNKPSVEWSGSQYAQDEKYLS